MFCGWIEVSKQGKDSLVTRKVDSITDTVQQHLRLILADNASQVDNEHKQEYRRRKLLQELYVYFYLFTVFTLITQRVLYFLFAHISKY